MQNQLNTSKKTFKEKPGAVVEVVALMLVSVIVVVLGGEAGQIKIYVKKYDVVVVFIIVMTLTCPQDTAGDRILLLLPGSQKQARVQS